MLKRLLLIFPVFIPLWLFAQSTSSQEHQLLWKITGKELTKPSWLYGTIHVRDPRAFELSDSALFALQSADLFGLELHPDSVIRSVMLDVMRRTEIAVQSTEPRYQRFDEFLTASEQQKLQEKLLTETGMSLDQVDPNQPGLFQHLLSPEPVKRKGRPTFLDAWLFQSAKLMGQEVVGLERLEEQSVQFSKTTVADAWKSFLRDADPMAAEASFDRLLDAYRAGDLDYIWTWTQQQWTESDRLKMASRNEKLTQRGVQQLRSGKSCFFAVGVSHLPGESGLISRYRKAGYRVEPVSASFSPQNKDWQPPKRKIPWVLQDQSPYGYSLEWPVEPVLFVKESIVEMHFIPDVGTGNTYYAGWIRLPVIPDPDDEEAFLGTLTQFLSREGEATEVTYRKEVLDHGVRGREMGLRYQSGQFFRSRFYLRDNYVYLLLAGPGESDLQAADAERFFESFHFSALGDKPWEKIISLKGGFSASMPSGTQELSQRIYSPEEGWTMNYHLWSGGDPETGANYTLRYNIFPADLRPENDEEFFRSNLEELAGQMEGEILYEKMQKGANPSFEFQMEESSTGNQYLGKYLLKGAKSCMLLVTANADTLQTTDAKIFFDSFKWIPGSEMKGGQYELTDFGVKLWFPDLPAVNTAQYTYSDPEEPWGKLGTFFAQDSLTGITWYYNRESYSPFAWVEDTSEFVRQWTNALLGKENGDRLFAQQTTIEEGYLTLDVKVENANHHLVFRRKIWLRAQEVHSLSAWFPPGVEEGEQARHFFASLEFIEPPAEWDLFEDKRPGLLRELAREGGSRKAAAAKALLEVPFSKKYLPELHKLLENPLQDDEESWGTREKVISIVAELNDPSSVAILKNQLEEREKWGLEPEVVLQALAKMKNPAAVKGLEEILKTQPPDLMFDADGYGLLVGLTDSIQLYRQWVEWVPELAKNPDYELGAYLFLDYGLSTGVFSKKDLEPHWLVLLERGEDLLKMEKNGLLTESSAWEPRDFLEALVKVFSHAGYLPETGGFLRKMQEANDPLLKLMAYEILTAYGYAPDPDFRNELAAHPRTRIPLWDILQEYDKTDLYPSKYLKQSLMAEGVLMNLVELYAGKQIVEMKEVDSKAMTLRGTKGRGYLFKYKLKGEENWKLGFSGLQPSNKKEFLTDTRFNVLLEGDLQGSSKEELYELVVSRVENGIQ